MENLAAAVGIRPPAPRPAMMPLGEVLNNASTFLRGDVHTDEIGALAVGIMMHRRAQLGGHLLTPNDYRRVEQIKKIVLDAQSQEQSPRPSVPADRETPLLAAVEQAVAKPVEG